MAKPPQPDQTQNRSLPTGKGSNLPGLHLQGWRLWGLRLVAIVGILLLALLVVEGSLHLVGYGAPVSFFVKDDSGGGYITNERFIHPFYSRHSNLKPDLFILPARKPAGTIRICILGESAAMGTPDPAFSFGRILEVMLRRSYPDKRFEVINAAMRGINSHVIRRIANECVHHEIDLFIVYVGNNEVVGFCGADPYSPAWTQSLTYIRAAIWLKSTRLGQLFGDLTAPADSSQAQSMVFFREHRLRPDDLRRTLNRDNFRANLLDICRVTTESGAKVILCTTAVNLRDCPPLGSLHRAKLTAGERAAWERLYESGAASEDRSDYRRALDQFAAAARMDDTFADLQFRLARCYLALGELNPAKEHYTLARDWDSMQFRADSRINSAIRELAAGVESRGVKLVDVEMAFASSELSEEGIPGGKLFYDHVHPSFSGNYLIAKTCYTAVCSAVGGGFLSGSGAEIPTESACAKALAFNQYQEFEILGAMIHQSSKAPFLDQLDHDSRQHAAEAANERRRAAFDARDAQICLQTYQAAIRENRDDWRSRFNLGFFYETIKQHKEATEQFRYLVNQFPRVKRFRVALGNSLAAAGDKPGAEVQLREALRLDPSDAQLRRTVAQFRQRP